MGILRDPPPINPHQHPTWLVGKGANCKARALWSPRWWRRQSGFAVTIAGECAQRAGDMILGSEKTRQQTQRGVWLETSRLIGWVVATSRKQETWDKGLETRLWDCGWQNGIKIFLTSSSVEGMVTLQQALLSIKAHNLRGWRLLKTMKTPS